MADKPPSAWQIENAVSAWMRARGSLLNAGLVADEAALQELLGPEAGDIYDLLDRTLRAAHHAKNMAEMITKEITDLTARRDRYAKRYETLRVTAQAIMDVLGQRKREIPELTGSIRAGAPFVNITDTKKLEDRFFRTIPAERVPDKVALREAMVKDGEVLDGAEMSNGASYLIIDPK